MQIRIPIALFVLLVAADAVLAQTVPPANPNPSIGVIDVGAAFGWLQPYVNAAVGALLTALATWVMWALKTKLGLQIEDSHRDAYLTAAKNRAAELIAKGFVSMQERGKVEIDNRALADAVNTLVRAVPDAVKQFNIKESDIERTITAMVPQIPETAVVEGKVVAAPPANGVLAPKAERR
jgi:hypothetical protein